MILPLSSDQIEAARQLVHALAGVPIGIVGAAALGCHLPLRNKTEDVDFVVAASVASASALLSIPGWTRHVKNEHAWTAPNGVAIDVVPASAEALTSGVLEWPETGHRMNLCGIRLVFEQSPLVQIAEGVKLLVPPVPVITLLKMVAYLDRYDCTDKDLAHLAQIFDGYPDDDDDRMFTQEQAVAGMSLEEARIQVLARELAALVNVEEREACRRFVRQMRVPSHEARMLRYMSQPSDDREALQERRLTILEAQLAL